MESREDCCGGFLDGCSKLQGKLIIKTLESKEGVIAENDISKWGKESSKITVATKGYICCNFVG